MTRVAERLLVLSCSARKNRFDSPRPAFAVYDGPAFKVVRRYCARSDAQTTGGRPRLSDTSRAAPGLLVLIISAQYGVLPWARPLDYYDARLDCEAVRPEWCEQLRHYCLVRRPDSAFFYGGRAYQAAVPSALWRPSGMPVEASVGGIGLQLARLKAWLHRGE